MNIKYSLKRALFRRILEKRKSDHPFLMEEAERYLLPADAGASQNNSYYFSCHDQKGASLLIRHAQRGADTVEVWFAYRDADGNAYICTEQLCPAEAATTGVTCVEPGKTWTFSFDGDVAHLKTGAVSKARFNGMFSATGGIFEFGHDVDARVLAGAIAKEKWSRAYFADLQGNDQTHYEQPGRVTGTLSVDNVQTGCDYTAMRDHSFGKRDWNYMNRHFWLMAMFEDGRSLNANMVSYPALHALTTGYYLSGGQTQCVEDVQIRGGTVRPHEVPESFTLEARLFGGALLSVKCLRQVVFAFPFENGAYTIYEGIGTFELDGVGGRGILEFGWNKDPARYAQTGGAL